MIWPIGGEALLRSVHPAACIAGGPSETAAAVAPRWAMSAMAADGSKRAAQSAPCHCSNAVPACVASACAHPSGGSGAADQRRSHAAIPALECAASIEGPARCRRRLASDDARSRRGRRHPRLASAWRSRVWRRRSASFHLPLTSLRLRGRHGFPRIRTPPLREHGGP